MPDMNLHHTSGKPDWEYVDKHEYNPWQRLGASTKGVMTPGNTLTIVGFTLVIIGLYEIVSQHFWMGAGLLALGRLLDIADGWVADATGTKSPLGELLDASIDKLSTLVTVLVFYALTIAPRWILIILLLPHAAIAVIALIAYIRKKNIHPHLIGKLSMAMVWLTMIGFILVRALRSTGGGVATLGVYALAALSVIMGIYALYCYIAERD